MPLLSGLRRHLHKIEPFGPTEVLQSNMSMHDSLIDSISGGVQTSSTNIPSTICAQALVNVQVSEQELSSVAGSGGVQTPFTVVPGTDFPQLFVNVHGGASAQFIVCETTDEAPLAS